MTPRADVFSLKGGVGKTTLCILLARRLADLGKTTRGGSRPVLIVDADLLGTCLGDLLQPAAQPRWYGSANLAHLVCGRPELLHEQLQAPPVYEYRVAPSPAEATQPRRVVAGTGGVVFCPSHAHSGAVHGLPEVSLELLQALAGHESAGGWVNHVIDRLVEATTRVVGELAAVLVDHSPGMAAVQERALSMAARQPARRAVVVTSRDAVDLAMTSAFEAACDEPRRSRITWVVNRTAPNQALVDCIPGAHRPGGEWFRTKALPLGFSQATVDSYANSEAIQVPDQGQLDAILGALFP